jgi:hypothetical protein
MYQILIQGEMDLIILSAQPMYYLNYIGIQELIQTALTKKPTKQYSRKMQPTIMI